MRSVVKSSFVRQAARLVCVPLLAGALLLAQPAPPPPPGSGQISTPLLAPQQLDTLVAPVALYPDRLLSQLLVASTYPLEVAEAAQWMQQNGNLQGQQLVDAAREQNWDPSIQAMVVFPDVLTRLASDIRWTTDLGNAFLAQQGDVMSAVQRMRAQAQASGKLRSNSQQTVTSEMQGDQSAIDIQPANPEVVYVPYYNPEYIWGPPVGGYYPPWDYLDVGFGYGYGFGPGIYIGGFFGGLGWGGWGWGPNWFGRSIFCNAFFFNHYGFGGVGFRGGVWAHNASHRLGIAYPNASLRGRYNAASVAGARSSFAGSRYSSGYRGGVSQNGGWNRFGSGAGTARAGSSYAGGNAYRGSTSLGNSYGANRASPSYRSTPSYGGTYSGNRAMTPSYRSNPSYGASRGSVYSGGGSVHSYGGSVHSGGSVRSSGGGGSRGGSVAHSSGGGGGFHGGGGGGSHGGGGGHGGHR